MKIEAREASPAYREGLLLLFEATGSPCYCRYFHFAGPTDAWLERCASGKADNQREFEHALRDGSDEARGLVALARDQGETRVVGWVKVAPATVMQKAYQRRLYKGLPCFEGDRTGVYLIGCMLVHPGYRKQGVATTLVEAAVEAARSWGALTLEALPRRPKEPVNDEELWTGPMGAFAKHGFQEVHGFEPYPVLRRTL